MGWKLPDEGLTLDQGSQTSSHHDVHGLSRFVQTGRQKTKSVGSVDPFRPKPMQPKYIVTVITSY